MQHTNSSMVLLVGAVIASALSCSSAKADIFSDDFTSASLGAISFGPAEIYAQATANAGTQGGATVVDQATSTAFGTP